MKALLIATSLAGGFESPFWGTEGVIPTKPVIEKPKSDPKSSWSWFEEPSVEKMRIPLPVRGAVKIVKPFGRVGEDVNSGIDLAVGGRQVLAVVDGQVSDWHGDLMLTHPSGWRFLYRGLSEVSDRDVRAGEPLGVAQTLHFEVIDPKGRPRNPVDYFKARLVLPSGRRLSYPQVTQVLRSAGWHESILPTMACVAYYESGWRIEAKNVNRNGTQDTGLLQINDTNLGLCGLARADLHDPLKNASCGLKVYRKQGLRAWIAFRKHPECEKA